MMKDDPILHEPEPELEFVPETKETVNTDDSGETDPVPEPTFEEGLAKAFSALTDAMADSQTAADEFISADQSLQRLQEQRTSALQRLEAQHAPILTRALTTLETGRSRKSDTRQDLRDCRDNLVAMLQRWQI